MSFQTFVIAAEDAALFYLLEGIKNQLRKYENHQITHKCALFLFNQLEESLRVFIVMFLSLGTDYQTFGTVAESKEN